MKTQPKFFTVGNFNPQTGEPFPKEDAKTATALARNLGEMDKIFVLSPQHRALFAAFDRLRLAGIAAGTARKEGLRNAAPSGAGKTTAAVRYREYVHGLGLHSPGEEPVVIISLDRACTSKRLWGSICDYFGDAYSTRGTEDTLRKRAYMLLREFGVKILVIDEVQHLAFRSSERNDVTDALKRTLDDGIVSLVFSGTEAARPMLVKNVQLSMRMQPPCDIRPLDPSSTKDVTEMTEFLARYDAELVKRELTRQPSALDDPRKVIAMLELSAGVVGRVVKLIRFAYGHAFSRNADLIELHDLSHAAVHWAMAQQIVDRDPFRALAH